MSQDHQINEIMHKINEIHRLIVGSEHDKDTGLLSRVKDLESRVDSIQDTIVKSKWFLIGVGFFAGWGIIDIIKIIFK